MQEVEEKRRDPSNWFRNLRKILKNNSKGYTDKKGNYNPVRIMKKAVVKTEKIVNEYDQEIPQSQTADNPVAP